MGKRGDDNSAMPGEYYYYYYGSCERGGILQHLGAFLPMGFLVLFQFTPVICHQFLTAYLTCSCIIVSLCLSQHYRGFP